MMSKHVERYVIQYGQNFQKCFENFPENCALLFFCTGQNFLISGNFLKNHISDLTSFAFFSFNSFICFSDPDNLYRPSSFIPLASISSIHCTMRLGNLGSGAGEKTFAAWPCLLEFNTQAYQFLYLSGMLSWNFHLPFSVMWMLNASFQILSFVGDQQTLSNILPVLHLSQNILPVLHLFPWPSSLSTPSSVFLTQTTYIDLPPSSL